MRLSNEIRFDFAGRKNRAAEITDNAMSLPTQNINVENMKKSILEAVFGTLLIAVGVLIILFFKDFLPRYIGGGIITAFGAVLVTSGIIGCAHK